MHYTYLLKSKKNNQLYIGSTNDLRKRIEDHNKGKVFSTVRYLPWKILYYEAYSSEKLARIREKRLKYNGNALRELRRRIGLLPFKLKSGAGVYPAPLPHNKSGAGFTLIEILIVVGIITLLATAVVVVLNPAKRFEDARDKQREIHLQTIYNAIEQKMTIEGGWFDCESLPQATTTDEEGEEIPLFKFIGTGPEDPEDPETEKYYDLYDCLVPKYLVNPLYDPAGGSEADTHYEIWQNPQTKRVTLRYLKDETTPPIVAGSKEYGVLTVPLHVETKPVTEKGHTTAVSGVIVYDDGGAYVFEAGVIWARLADLGAASCQATEALNELILENVMGTMFRTIDGAGSATEGESSFEFDSNLHSLEAGSKEYCVRAYARNEIGVGYGQTEQFATLNVGPEVYTFEEVYVGADIAKIEGEIRSLGIDYKVVSKAYFCYEQTDVPFDQDPSYCPIEELVASNVTTPLSPPDFSAYLTGLDPNTPYHFKACALNDIEGRRCGEVYGFTTLGVSLPVVETIKEGEEETEVGPYWIKVGGYLHSTGGEDITERGFCFSSFETDPCHFGAEWCVQATEGELGLRDKGKFYAYVNKDTIGEDLVPGNTYYICAYASNNDLETSWGETEEYQTVTVKPNVTTKEIPLDKITHSSAESGGVVDDGGATVCQWGVCWEEAPSTPEGAGVDPESNPLNCTVNDGPGWDDFTSSISVYSGGLWGNTNYNVQAYAINSKGTGWGNPVSFTTDPPVKPGLTTKEPSEFGPTSAESGGEVIDHGGAPIVGLGVCWVEGDPDIEPELTYQTAEDCPGVSAINKGTFSITIEELFPGRTYWVRAFARNRDVSEYGYGDMFSFTTTPPDLPTVRNVGDGPTESGSDWAKIEGEVTDDGGDSSTERGICYGTNHLPTFDFLEGGGKCLYHEIGGVRTTGEGKFEVTINDLEAGIQYYARAFATNTAGLVYADGEIPFSTAKPNGSTCTDSSQCISGICNREGICCSTPCDTPCWSCKIEPNVGTCSPVPTGQDWGEGPDGDCERTMDCDGPCKAYGDPGYCNGEGACALYISAEYAPDDGQVCLNGDWQEEPSASAYCDMAIQCSDHACTAERWYRGCEAGTTNKTCTETSKKKWTNNWNASASHASNESTYKTGILAGTPTCNQVSGRYCGSGCKLCNSSGGCTNNQTAYGMAATNLGCSPSGSVPECRWCDGGDCKRIDGIFVHYVLPYISLYCESNGSKYRMWPRGAAYSGYHYSKKWGGRGEDHDDCWEVEWSSSFPACYYCHNMELSGGGYNYDDWYLPTYSEYKWMMEQSAALDVIVQIETEYWTAIQSFYSSHYYAVTAEKSSGSVYDRYEDKDHYLPLICTRSNMPR